MFYIIDIVFPVLTNYSLEWLLADTLCKSGKVPLSASGSQLYAENNATILP